VKRDIPMDLKTYLKVSGINCLFLVSGLLLGPVAVNSSHYLLRAVHAQAPGASSPTPSASPTKAQSKPEPEPAKAEDTSVEYVSPSISTGTAGFNTLLSNRIACDSIQAGGFDLLKLQNAILLMLYQKGILKQGEIDSIASSGKPSRLLRIKQ
jgi:hypothetical protein